jgi:uncharacterized protein YecT (DUF1311 family)
MLSRRLRACGFGLLTAVACSHGNPRADSSPVTTTREMSQGLTRDVQQSDRDLAALQDSLYSFLGDTIAAVLKQARANWEQYRKLECDAIRVAFAPGTMAPIAQMECYAALTDERRRFLVEHYDYMHSGKSTVQRR